MGKPWKTGVWPGPAVVVPPAGRFPSLLNRTPMQPAKKETTHFTCGQCGYASRNWLGRCPDCGAWDSLTEERQVAASRSGRPAATAQPRVAADGGEEGERLVSGIAEMDRVLGGGIVPGSLVLIGGDPGVAHPAIFLLKRSNTTAK